MKENKPIIIELFFTLTCPNCRIFKKMLAEVLPKYGNKFKLKTSNANSPLKIVKTFKKGIHAVPTLLIDNIIVYKEVPTKSELINKLDSY